MADTYTEHLHLIKQDPDTAPDIAEEHNNMEILDQEVFARGKKFNGKSVESDGEFHIDSIPYAENIATSASQKSNETFIIRTSGGEASIPQKGDAWLTLIRGTHRHENYVPQSINMTVTPMARVAPPAITATIDEETFESYVSGEAGTYTISYTTEWDTSPTLYGLTVINAPVDGDSITIVWDGEDDAVVTVNAVPRPTPESIDATIDEDVFVAYVASSGTVTLTYSTGWSADPSLYGITVTGTPIAGDVITVVYVKEVRGTIYQSDPSGFISTGWNLYNHAAGYARVIKYSDTYGFKISGTYTGLEFSTTITGSRVSLTPVSGYFTVPSDGYVFVSGGNTTDTALWMTWSDWGSGYNWTGSEQGDFEVYEEHQIDLSTFMAENFPYGLMEVGTMQDEINLNTGVAVSNVQRLVYNSTNLANAKASGLQYEYDENYIYIERSNPVEYFVEIDGDYTAFDHGMELFTGTEQDVYSETVYGANLKNKLERDVLTISQQTLTTAQKSQIRTNLSAASQADVDSLSSNLNKLRATKQISDSNAFENRTEMFYDWNGYLANKTGVNANYISGVRIAVGDPAHVKLIMYNDAGVDHLYDINVYNNTITYLGSLSSKMMNPTQYTSGIFTPETGITVSSQKATVYFDNIVILELRLQSSTPITETRKLLGTLASSFIANRIIRWISPGATVFDSYVDVVESGFITYGQVYIDKNNTWPSGGIIEINVNVTFTLT